MNALLMVVTTSAALLHYLLVGRKRGWLNVDGIFVLSMWTMAVGTLWILDNDSKSGNYAFIISVPFLIYVATSSLIYDPNRASRPSPLEAKGRVRLLRVGASTPVLLALLVAATITTLYYITLGYNVFTLGISGIITGQQQDYTTLRLDAYSTSTKYLFPGYVNQFKNIILPAVCLIWIHQLVAHRSPWAAPGTVALVSITALSLLGTGQRGAFTLFTLATLVYVRRVAAVRFWRIARRILVVVAPLMFIATTILGRSALALQEQTSRLGRIGVIADEIWRRFFYENQFSGIVGYHLVEHRPTQWGAEWAQGVMGILPGNSGSTLGQEIFYSLYGTTRGGAPISTWGSVYYNFGWAGLVVIPAALALAWGRLADLHNRIQNPNSLEVVGAAGFAAIAGNWIAGGPEYLLNAGAITSALMWWAGARLEHYLAVEKAQDAISPLRSTDAPSTHAKAVLS